MANSQCAVNPDGSLKDASEIVFYNDVDDMEPISGPSATGAASGDTRLSRNKHSKMLQAVEDGATDEDPPKRKKRRMKKGKKSVKGSNSSEGSDYEEDGLSMDSSEDPVSDILNEERAAILTAKTFPPKPKISKPAKKKRRVQKEKGNLNQRQSAGAKTLSRAATVEEVEDEEAPPQRTISSANLGSAKRTNPIYLFFKEVSVNAKGLVGEKGDRHFQCLHGSQHILTITKKMNGSLNGPITQQEIDIAAGRASLDATFQAALDDEIEKRQETIKESFSRQQAAAQEPWDQAKFKDLLVKWIVACNQPFTEVEQQEFVDLLQYVHHSGGTLQIPKQDAIRHKVFKLGENTIKEMREMFLNLCGKVALSIDAWTSSNQYPFLAIVAHYIADDGVLEECLIDFRELEGEHSGENMAEAVWKTLELYGLVGKIIAIVMDNATNNNTMMQSLEERCRRKKIPFSAKAAHMRCMPHTIHLAAIKASQTLLEGIGAISSKTSQKLSTRTGNYQDNFTIIQDKTEDDDEAGEFDEADDALEDLQRDGITPAVAKLRKIVRHVRSSPQRRAAWLRQIDEIYSEDNQEIRTYKLLMLILDVVTRWGSTHQMMRRAYQFRDAIDSYASASTELQNFCLSAEEWEVIEMVTSWLKQFRIATVQMSATKTPMLSRTLEIMQDLEQHVRDIVASLPASTPTYIRDALVASHNKLSEYYYKFDESPFYTWSMLLDPRIDWDVLKENYQNDVTLNGHLQQSKSQLRTYFQDNYLSRTSTQSAFSSSAPVQDDVIFVDGSPQKKKTSRYHHKVDAPRDELTEFWKQPPQDGEKCNPIEWWQGQKATFPNLYRLALDIFSIPGSAVAVERVFSGGRDTISLRRASLHQDTIRMLMIAKNRLLLTRRRRN
ncbi:hypothetical protein D9758_018466 [Tetrapyrgos nigripes]|uniref:HAT C-terminal dimerisation domain-containing protein n=1 Tax=Tetrapyrgos nigripes TaxID=182062 RepID=A0A8H5B6R6_9AGAR|nr:hypothetical protein D9758_018466 [Tetrapyrgos nigripes]